MHVADLTSPGVSEEQICETFGRVGQVVNFRLVYDKETGKPKGFGFLEFTDPDAAAAAVRNLNDFEIMGRNLRVDWSNDNGGGGDRNNQDGGSGRAPPPPHMNMTAPTNGYGAPTGTTSNALPPLPPGVPVPEGLTCPDAISQTLQQLPPPQLLDIITQMKALVASDSARATELLTKAPQLSYAIFQALLLLGLVDTSVLGSIIAQGTGPQPMQPVQPPQPQYVPPQPQFQPQPPQPYQQYPPQGYAPTPPVQPPYQAPPPQQSQAEVQAQAQQQLLQQVLSMTPGEIFALDEGPRSQIIALRAQLGKPVV